MAVYRLPSIDLSTKTLGVAFQVASELFSAPCWVLLYNESPFLLNLDMPDGAGEQLNPFLADWFYVGGNAFNVTPVAFLNLANPPSTQLLIRVYTTVPPAERSYPLDLSRATIISGSVTSTLTQIINSGEGVPSDIIKDTPAGFTNPSVHLDNTPYLQLNGHVGGTFFPFMRISDDAGTLKSEWRFDASGRLVLVDLATGLETIRLHPSSNGITISGLGGRVLCWSRFTGTGTGTFNHGLGTTPNVVLPMEHAAASQTMGWDSETSTQVHITAGGGAAWVAMALLMA